MSDEVVGDGLHMRASDAKFAFRLAIALNRVTIPAPIITVRSYAGETEDEALARYGLERTARQAEFVSLI